MVGLKGILHPGLLDERYWGERLREEAAVPLRMLVLPSAEDTDDASEAFELLVSGRDGARLRALLVRHSNPSGQEQYQPALRLLAGHGHCRQAPCSDCGADLYFEPDPHKRLEERVLDTLRMLRAARRVDGVAGTRALATAQSDATPLDEFLIAECLLNRGWI
jgi:hypothetical protein